MKNPKNHCIVLGGLWPKASASWPNPPAKMVAAPALRAQSAVTMPGSHSRWRVRLPSSLGAPGSMAGARAECGKGTGQGGGRVSSPRRRGTERVATGSSAAAFDCDEGAPMEGGGLWWFVWHKSYEGEVRDKFTRWETAQRNDSPKWGGDGGGSSKSSDSGGGSWRRCGPTAMGVLRASCNLLAWGKVDWGRKGGYDPRFYSRHGDVEWRWAGGIQYGVAPRDREVGQGPGLTGRQWAVRSTSK
jgi:hypothetical protein